MHQIGVARLLRVERNHVTMLEPLIQPLRTVVQPLLETLDLLDFLLQTNKRLFHLRDLFLRHFSLVLETDEMPQLLRLGLLFLRRLSRHGRSEHAQHQGQTQQS